MAEGLIDRLKASLLHILLTAGPPEKTKHADEPALPGGTSPRVWDGTRDG
jgi:hypothetical protein